MIFLWLFWVILVGPKTNNPQITNRAKSRQKGFPIFHPQHKEFQKVARPRRSLFRRAYFNMLVFRLMLCLFSRCTNKFLASSMSIHGIHAFHGFWNIPGSRNVEVPIYKSPSFKFPKFQFPIFQFPISTFQITNFRIHKLHFICQTSSFSSFQTFNFQVSKYQLNKYKKTSQSQVHIPSKVFIIPYSQIWK